MNLGTGKCSTFGGPSDTGVGVAEGLSCIDPVDLSQWWFSRLFLPYQPPGTSGLARKLNPQAFYIAMRWGYGSFNGVQGEILPNVSRQQIRESLFLVSYGEQSVYAQAADWGPNTDTGRLVDCSPGVLAAIGATTDNEITVEVV